MRACRRRNATKTKHLIGMLVTQHAKWIAQRLRRPHFGQTVSAFRASSDQYLDRQTTRVQKVTLTKPREASAEEQTRNNCGQMRSRKAAFSNNEEAAGSRRWRTKRRDSPYPTVGDGFFHFSYLYIFVNLASFSFFPSTSSMH